MQGTKTSFFFNPAFRILCEKKRFDLNKTRTMCSLLIIVNTHTQSLMTNAGTRKTMFYACYFILR